MNRLGKRRNPSPVVPEAKSSRAGNVQLYISNPTTPTLTRIGLTHSACAYNHKSDLLLLYGYNIHHSYLILTPEGYLVTKVKLGSATNLFEQPTTLAASFTDEQILIEIFKYTIFLSTDYRLNIIHHKGSVFDCDDNGNIYISINHERRIAIHSSDFIFKSNFPEYPTQTGEMIALTIKGNLMVVLSESTNYSNSRWDDFLKIHKYSLTTEKLIQKCIIADCCTIVPDLLCIDRFENILLMEKKKSDRYCVLYKDGSVTSYSLGDEFSIQYRKVGFSITNSLELILVFTSENICVYNISIN